MDYETLAAEGSIDKTIASLKSNNFDGLVVESGAEALAKIKELIPKGASVMNGASTTLQQIGFIDYLKDGAHGWNNLHATILAETDKEKQGDLRKQAILSDYYLGSVHALSQTGEMVIASNTGSQLPHLAYTSPNLVLVVSTKKITPDLMSAFERLDKHVVPKEDVRLMGVYNAHTMHSKTLILHKENPNMGRRVLVILVKENLGF
jgi:hypothetical protein